jgi:hypothetical protein
MARAHLKHIVREGSSSRVIQNAAVYVYQDGTTTNVTGMWSAPTGGSALSNPLISNAQGEVEAWLDTAQRVDLKVTDNGDAAKFPNTSGTVSFADFTEDEIVYHDPADVDAKQALADALTVINVVKKHGADPTFATDSTAAIQAAIDEGVAAGAAIIFFPKGRYKVTAPLNISGDRITFKGVARSAAVGEGSVINSETGDLFTTAAARRYIVFEDLQLLCSTTSSGHIFNLGGDTSFWTWNRCRMRVQNPAKSIITSTNRNFLDNLMMDCYLSAQDTTWTVPLINLVTNTGGINANTFTRLRCEYSGNYFFHIEETAAGQYVQDNVFRDINFEITTGGNIRIASGRNNTIENCNTYDLQAVGATTRNLYEITKSAAGTASRGNTFRNVCRRAGTLGTGLFDIALIAANAGTTLIEGCNGAIDCGNTTAVLLSLLTTDTPAAVVTNREARTVDIDYQGVQIGGTGAKMLRHWSTTFTNDFAAIAAQSEAGLNVSLVGVALGDAVTVTPNGAPETGLIWEGFVSAADIVRVRLINYTTASIDPASRTYRVTVTRY